MDRFQYDKSSKWLLRHHGDSLLRLGGVGEIASWRACQAEVVQPRQLPDGLLEVQLAGETEWDLYFVEVGTHPEERVYEQLVRDLILVFAQSRKLPEALIVLLHPKGNARIADTHELRSRRGWSRLLAGWRVVELWTIPAEQLLATGDVGLVPWVLAAQITGPPEPVFRQCREIIDRQALAQEHANLLAVTQVLAGLRYNNPDLLALFGGRQAMIESPVIQEIVEEATAKIRAETKLDSLLKFLKGRFGLLPSELVTGLRALRDEGKLDDLLEYAGLCPDLEAFRARMQT